MPCRSGFSTKRGRLSPEPSEFLRNRDSSATSQVVEFRSRVVSTLDKSAQYGHFVRARRESNSGREAPMSSRVSQAIWYLVAQAAGVGRTQIVKFLYLADLEA